MTREEAVEKAARALCLNRGWDPDALQPGNIIVYPLDDLKRWRSPDGVSLDTLADNGSRPPDGTTVRGDKCHFMWRDYIGQAQSAVDAIGFDSYLSVVEAAGPFVEAIRELDEDVASDGLRCPDDYPVGDALEDGSQPTVGDFRALSLAVQKVKAASQEPSPSVCSALEEDDA